MNKKFFIRMIFTVIFVIGLQFAWVNPIGAQNTAKQKAVVKIEKIEKNGYIKGKVANLNTPQQYKVLIYVHTDQWYIHPYAGKGEGGSWASIEKDGSWSIPTVKHEPKANKVAALVVDSSIAKGASSELDNLEKIKKQAHAHIVYTEEEMQAKDKGWYGKL